MTTYLTLATAFKSPQHWGDVGGPLPSTTTRVPQRKKPCLGEEEEELKQKNEPNWQIRQIPVPDEQNAGFSGGRTRPLPRRKVRRNGTILLAHPGRKSTARCKDD